MADRLVERAQPERRKQLPRLFCDEAQVRLDHLRRPRVLRAQLGLLRRDSHRARVEVAGAHHEAAFSEQQSGAERKLVGAEQGCDDDVPTRLHAAVDPEPNSTAQARGNERLLCLRNAELPGRTGVLDRRQRARARPTVSARDVDHIRVRLCHADGDEADPTLRHELHRDVGVGVHLVEIEDQLCKILDRVDVVMRWRRDQRHTGLGVAQAGDLVGHLVRRDLSALTRLRALGDLDLQLRGRRRVLGGHPEAA